MSQVNVSRKRQPSLPVMKEPLREFGGGLLKNSHAKVKRPIACRRPMHVVLRSSRSRGARSLLSPRERRAVGVIAAETKTPGHEPGSDGRFANKPPNKEEKFGDQRPFAKILEWGRMHRSALKDLTQNMLEAIGFIPYQERAWRGSKSAPQEETGTG